MKKYFFAGFIFPYIMGGWILVCGLIAGSQITIADIRSGLAFCTLCAPLTGLWGVTASRL